MKINPNEVHLAKRHHLKEPFPIRLYLQMAWPYLWKPFLIGGTVGLLIKLLLWWLNLAP